MNHHALVDQHITELRHLAGAPRSPRRPRRSSAQKPPMVGSIRRRVGVGLVELGLHVMAATPAR